MPGLTTGEIPVTARPTVSHEADFNFTCGFYRDFDLTILIPVATNHFASAGAPAAGGTGLGDAMLLVKYRFSRRDSSRGTAQASFTFGPKLPTGRTNLTGEDGRRLPAGLQPGSGSTDLFLAANWTYTGLFNIKRLVADEDFHALVRSPGTQATRLGSDFTSRFWLSYRPYESKDGSREWFIGPVLTWLHSLNDRVAGSQSWAAAATFFSQESRPTSVFVPECISGSEWTGMRPIPTVYSSCLSAGTSVLESHSSFACTFSDRRSDADDKK